MLKKLLLCVVFAWNCQLYAAEESDIVSNLRNMGCLVREGVNIDRWCKWKFGNNWRANLIEHHVGGWSCKRTTTEHRSVNIDEACRLEYRNVVGVGHGAANNPYSWYCEINICN